MLYICTWNQLRLVREWLAEARDCNWSRYDQSLRERTWEVSGTICNTKTPCEDVFGDAMDKGKRGNKNGKISDWRLYWTMCNSEHAKNLPSVSQPNLALVEPPTKADSNLVFDVYSTEPNADLRLDKLKGPTTWKPAGPAANWRSAAATALLLWIKEHHDQYDVLCNVWLTKLLGEYQVYEDIATSTFLFSLGAWGKWAALALKMECRTTQWGTFFVFARDENGGLLLEWRYVVEEVSLSEEGPPKFSCGYYGVPTCVVPPSRLPPTLCKSGVVWMKDGEKEPLLVFALKHGTHLIKDELRKLTEALGGYLERGKKIILKPGPLCFLTLFLKTSHLMSAMNFLLSSLRTGEKLLRLKIPGCWLLFNHWTRITANSLKTWRKEPSMQWTLRNKRQ